MSQCVGLRSSAAEAADSDHIIVEYSERPVMTDSQHLGLTNEQREIVLRGLRFVRSAISMELLDPSDKTDKRRSEQLREVDGLVRQLSGTERAAAAV